MPVQTEPWTWCPQHPPTDVKGPHGFMDCEERERRFRDMLAACAGDMSRYGRVEDLGAAVLNAAGGHTAAGFCSAPHGAPDLSVPGWVEVAGDWRWAGAGPAPMREDDDDRA